MRSLFRLPLVIALLGLVQPGVAPAMNIEVRANTIYAGGPVGDDYLKFKQALAEPGIDTVVFVNSPGGELWDGLHIAHLIREKQVKTVIAGYCISACSIMFMGGKERQFSDLFRPAQTFIGIHGPHNKDTKAVNPQKAVQLLYFFEKGMGERFNEKVMKMAFYDMDDSDALLRVFDGARAPKRVAFHCRSGKTPRQECTNVPDQDALSLGIVTTNEFATVDLPPSFRPAPVVAGRPLNKALADPDSYFSQLNSKQCATDNCRKLATDFRTNKENKGLAIPLNAQGIGVVSDRESEALAFVSSIYYCNHIKDKPARLCEAQIVNGFDLRDLYRLAEEGHAAALEQLKPPAEKFYGNEEFGGGISKATQLQTREFMTMAPGELEGIKTYSTQELASATKAPQRPRLIDVSSFGDALPSAVSLFNGGLAFAETAKDAPYEARFAGLLALLAKDKEAPLIFYSAGRDWLGANAALRAKKLGYGKVGWYRGGLASWKAASLPVANVIIRAVVQ